MKMKNMHNNDDDEMTMKNMYKNDEMQHKDEHENDNDESYMCASFLPDLDIVTV